MIITNPINIISKYKTTKCVAQQKKSYSIQIINEYARKIIGKQFLNLSDKRKNTKLIQMASIEHKKHGIQGFKPIEAEYHLQQMGNPSKINIKTGQIMLGSQNKYWTTHKVLPPYEHGTVNCRFADKDLALDGLSKLIESGQITLPNEICLVVKGCDNNEAATKLRIYLEERLGINTFMIATDISLHALLETRGLDALVRSNLNKQNRSQYEESDIVLHDAFNKNAPLIINQLKVPFVELDFRLSIVAPRLMTENMVGMQEFVQSVIQESDICIMHFLENSALTFKTLETLHHYDKPKITTIQNIPVLYSQGRKRDIGLYTWDRKALEAFISKAGGRTLFLESCEAIEDSGSRVKVFSAIIEKAK